MPKKKPNKSSGVATAAAEDTTAQPVESTIPYDPNKDVAVTNSVPMPSGWGEGVITSEVRTCQETLRQMGLRSLSTAITANGETTSSGVRESRSVNAEIKSETGIKSPPADAVTPPLAAPGSPGAAGVPTGLEDTLKEGLDRAAEKLREFLTDLDITVTIKKTADGREIHIRSGDKSPAVPTSDEKDLQFTATPMAKIDVTAPRRTASGENVVRMVSESGGEPVTILSFGETGRATADDGGTTSNVMNSKNEVEQIGLINNFIGVNVSANIVLVNIQGTFS
jgi:hypothetical protein